MLANHNAPFFGVLLNATGIPGPAGSLNQAERRVFLGLKVPNDRLGAVKAQLVVALFRAGLVRMADHAEIARGLFSSPGINSVHRYLFVEGGTARGVKSDDFDFTLFQNTKVRLAQLGAFFGTELNAGLLKQVFKRGVIDEPTYAVFTFLQSHLPNP